jgi:predicted chitinase
LPDARYLDLINNRNMVIKTPNGRKTQVWYFHQQWDLVYADEYKGEPGKGEFNDRFGLYVERDFYVVSKLADGRYLDLINNRNMVIKTPNGRRTQVWYFDQRTVTIKTRLNNQSWDIQSSGRTENMQIWSTNSGWW